MDFFITSGPGRIESVSKLSLSSLVESVRIYAFFVFSAEPYPSRHCCDYRCLCAK